MAGGEAGQARDAPPEGLPIRDVYKSRIENVAAQHQPGPWIVYGDVIVQMAGGGNEGQLSLAQLEARRRLGPILESEEPLDFRHARRHQGRVRLIAKLVIPRDVVVVAMRVSDHELQGGTIMDGLPLVDDPLDDVADRERPMARGRSGARVQQQRPVRAE